MSLFLGKIHYWLYNKITWFEEIEGEIVKWAEEKGLPVNDWVQEVNEKYGDPTGNKPLEDIIDQSNIHGWLQTKIQGAELRQADLVTRILGVNHDNKKDLILIFAKQGEAAAKGYEHEVVTPGDIYNAMNDFILEGMPCDRVNEVMVSNEQEFIWETTVCLHTPYWEEVEGNVQNFYVLREAWIKAFVTTINSDFQYIKESEKINKIVRK